ncbi:YceI family protein [Aquimarina hainanensis]|uniref:YceI family protein n=1 Tax=Aquimarina hainanensis TaxID=1578017 RepID=A0ABW5NB60_9FLAO|nr:YceI family protein [Aquimarina sp. TRL1]QKX03462.1 YceI family protein [Aquimarina sp. TRL1]
MKNKLRTLTLILAISITSISFAQKKTINTTESSIIWTGKKVTGSHTGTLSFSKGFLQFKNNELTGGEFTVDMSSLAVTDLKAGKGKEDLEGHLSSDDFFGITTHKTATLVIKNATKKGDKYTVTADLTIKGKTNPVTFDLVVNGSTATSNLAVDRTKYDIKYGSGSFFDNLGDKAIHDKFELAISLKI